MSEMGTMSVELFVVIVFALMNLQIQIRLIALIWGRGCSWKQLLDIYDLNGKYKNWLVFDLIANSLLMIASTVFMTSLGWAASPISLGLIGIESLSFFCLPIRFFGAKISMQNNPNLLDFNGKYKDTCNEYQKLVLFLDEKHLRAYKKSAYSLWRELLLLNKRRQEAFKRKEKLELLKADVKKLINVYSLEQDLDKRKKAEARLSQIIKYQADIDEFTKQVEIQIKRSENVFMDIRTKLEVGQSDDILPDISNYTNQVKSLEYTVEAMDGGEVLEYNKQ